MNHQFDDLIKASCEWHGVPEDLLRALIQHESNWNPEAIGDGGLARGLGQMHPAAASEIGVSWGSLGEPGVAIEASAKYLAKYYKVLGDWSWTLAAYNQGPGVIGKAKAYADAVSALRGVA